MHSLADLHEAAALVHRHMPPTPQYAWPLLARRVGAQAIVKHENHTPTGAFKLRGGLTYLSALARAKPGVRGVVSATRGNHGQSLAFAGLALGIAATIVVPHGNSPEKNAAMRAFGATLVEHGADFDEARGEAARLAAADGLELVPSFHRDLLRGVSSYALELFSAWQDIDTVYVPIGCGSGICSVIGVRDLLGLRTKVVGVVSERADAVARSFEAGRPVNTETARTFADGMAVRVVVPEAFEMIRRGAERIVRVGEDGIAAAIRALFADTHNVAEGAGAAPLAALLQERASMRGRRVAVILCGGNIDSGRMATVLAGGTPSA